MLSLLSAGIAIVCGCATTSPKQQVKLTENSQPASTIVIAKKATKSARFAAFELQSHIKLISGATLPIVTADKKVQGSRILVGESALTKKLGLTGKMFGKQEYLIKFEPGTIVLMGKDKPDFGKFDYDYRKNKRAVNWPSFYDANGTMYAVYDFLRKYCGVNWVNPSDYGTVAPKKKTLIVSGCEIKRKPNMLYRGGIAAYNHRYQTNGGYWRKNTAGAKKYNQHAYEDIYKNIKHKHQIRSAVNAQNNLFQYRMKAGGEQSQCNHSFYNYYERFWKKKNNNFESYHPEYFAQGYKGDTPPQLCYSNPATIKQVVKDIRGYFDNGGYKKRMHSIGAPGYHWGENFFALEPMDNSAFCKCDACTSQYEPERKKDKSQHSTYWFTFVNKVAEEIKKSHPDKKISTLAYMTHEGLPSGFKMADNVVVHFCISGNRQPYNKEFLGKQLERLQEWYDKEDVPMYLWLYNCFPLEIANNGRFYAFPGHFAHVQKQQYDYFKKLGIKGVFHCGFNGEVDNYVAYRLMDDPDLDIDVLLDEYFSAYGKAGKPLRKMYELIEDRYCNVENYPKGGDGSPFKGHQTVGAAWGYLGNAETMKQLQSYMDQAYALAEADQQKQLIKLWDESLWAYMKAGRKSYVDRMSFTIPEVIAPKVANAHGDVSKVDWNKAVSLGDKWYKRGGKQPSVNKMGGLVCHDGEYLYLKLIDYVDPQKLEVSPQIACFDDWEIFVAGQRAQPFRQYMIGPTAMIRGISYGEVNWRQGVLATEYTKKAFGLKAVSDTNGNKWILELSFPLSDILEKPIKPGDDIYANFMRVRNPVLSGERPYGIDTWVAYTTVKDVDRLAKIHLAK